MGERGGILHNRGGENNFKLKIVKRGTWGHFNWFLAVFSTLQNLWPYESKYIFEKVKYLAKRDDNPEFKKGLSSALQINKRQSSW